MEQEWHWHFAPICAEGYAFKGADKCYYARATPNLIVDLVYTHEGEQVYVTGFRGEGFNLHALKAILEPLKQQGVLWARWEHNGNQMKCDILTGKITRDTDG